MESHGGRGGQDAEARRHVVDCVPGGGEGDASVETPQAGAADGSLYAGAAHLHHYGDDDARLTARSPASRLRTESQATNSDRHGRAGNCSPAVAPLYASQVVYIYCPVRAPPGL